MPATDTDKARQRTRYATDPAYREAKRAASRASYQANKAKINAERRTQRAADPEAARAKDRAARAANLDLARARDRRWKKNNPEAARRQNAVRRFRKYGLTPAQYERLVVRQLWRCALCQIDLDKLKPNHIHIDHCHKTNRVRGVLCSCCNVLLGMAKEDVTTLQRAVAYLQRSYS